jgi:SAM-dependent methyltransferase
MAARHRERRCLTGYDAELQRHDDVLHRACGIQARDHVLDIGCGTGQTTRQAAHSARQGTALGVDVSATAIERARELARAEAQNNVTFERGDAQIYPFPREQFDLAISRFGTMFFGDPAAAFANIWHALRPGGRLVMMVWQSHERNEWDITVRQALDAAGGPMNIPAGGPVPFSLADPQAVTELLEAVGFSDIAFTDVREPVYYGADVATAIDWVRGFSCTNEILKQLEPAAEERALARLRDALAAHLSDDGVWFDSRAWIVTAGRR